MRIKPKKSLITKSEYDPDIDELDLYDDPVFLSLSPGERRFIYYLYLQEIKNWTNIKTYKEAYNKPNMSPEVAGVRYNDKLRNGKIYLLKKKIINLIQKKLELIPKRIIEEENTIAFSDVAKYFDNNGHLLIHPSRLPEKARRAISSIKAVHSKSGAITYEVSLWNKGASLSRLQSIFGMNQPNKIELSGPGGGSIEVDHKYDFSLLSYDEKRNLKELLTKCKVE